MGDHFVLLVDRLLTESTLEAAIESKNRLMQSAASTASETKMEFEKISSPRKLVECRICHDEEEDSNMETPCSCCGSLKVNLFGFSLIISLLIFMVCFEFKHLGSCL